MVIPWDGFPLAKLIDLAQPKAEAKYVKFTSFFDPEQCPGQRSNDLPWPYAEGLTLPEAMNELAFLATGPLRQTAAQSKRRANSSGCSMEIWIQER